MPSARSPLARRIVGLAAVPALLAGLAACGDDDEGAGGDFCEQARSVDSAFDEIDDPSSADFSEAIDRLQEMDPPAEIAEEWDQLMSSLDAFEDIDLENPDPEALAELDTEEMQEASDKVDEYMSEECGIE
jgi:hypothetical protein